MLQDKDKKKPLKADTEERYGEKQSVSRVYGIFAGLLQSMPVASVSFIVRHSGKSWTDVAEEMMRDPHVQSVFRSRSAGVAGRTWNLIPADESPKAQEIADFVNDVLNQTPNFEHCLAHLLKAVSYGHSVTEVVWREDTDAIRIDALKTRRHDRFTLSDDGKDVMIYSDTGMKEPVAERKIIYHRHEMLDDAPFEEPLLLTLYWPWFFKKNALGFWMVVAEKFGIPSVVGKYPQHFTDDDVKSLVTALTNLQQDSVAAVPLDTQIDTELGKLSVGEKGNFFKELLDSCNAEISKAVLGGTLTQEIGDKGSYAASKTHQEVRQEIVEKDAKALQSTLDATLVMWLVEYNYGEQVADELCPGIVFNVQPDRGTNEFANTLKTLSDMGFKVPEQFIAETFGLPEVTFKEKEPPAFPGFSEKDKKYPFE